MKTVKFIFDVLADLAKFAKKNEMFDLESAIFETQHVARNEIMQRKEDSNYRAVMDAVFPDIRELNTSDTTK
ncbi:hypothetical protein [Sulfitobacter sp.]|uniref:hypothetical protein n=1 Tax=Sulfitobacter sp. TaxID=1903071 RepID=UPI0030024A86